MAKVSIIEAVRYGFVVIAYFIGILILGGIVGTIGLVVLNAAGGGIGGAIVALIGIIIGIIGYIIILGAGFGILYKIISDGVQRGMKNIDKSQWTD